MKITIQKLKSLVQKISSKYIPIDEATYYSNEIVESYLRKYPRTNVLEREVLEDTLRFKRHSDNKLQVTQDHGSILQIDFNRLPVSYFLKFIHEKLLLKAKENGIAIFSFTNSSGMHTLTTYVHKLAKEGMFVLSGFNAGPNAVIPNNGTKGILGNNPIAYAFPIKNDVQIVDMATSEIPLFDLFDAKKKNEPIPIGTAVDKLGQDTTNPESAIIQDDTFNLKPIGGTYKGYAINYLIEILTGSLIGAKLSNEMDPAYINEEHGGFIIAIDISKFTSLTDFIHNTEELNSTIRSQEGKDGVKITVPGDRNRMLKNNRVNEKAVKIDKELLNKLRKIA